MKRAVALLTLCASFATAQVTRTETQSVLVDVLVTDNAVSDTARAMLDKAGVKLIVAE